MIQILSSSTENLNVEQTENGIVKPKNVKSHACEHDQNMMKICDNVCIELQISHEMI